MILPPRQALLIEVSAAGGDETAGAEEGVVANGEWGPKTAAGGFDETLAGVGAVDVARVAEIVVFEDLSVVVEMIGKVDVVVIP